MSKPNLIAFIKSIFVTQNNTKGKEGSERSALPDPIIVGFIFTVLCIIAITFILIS